MMYVVIQEKAISTRREKRAIGAELVVDANRNTSNAVYCAALVTLVLNQKY